MEPTHLFLIGPKATAMTTLLNTTEKELKIEGFMTNQNVQSTKHAVHRKPLKIKKSASGSENSDPTECTSFMAKNSIPKPNYSRRGERNIPKYRLLSKPLSNEQSNLSAK